MLKTNSRYGFEPKYLSEVALCPHTNHASCPSVAMIEGLQANNDCSPGNCEIGDNPNKLDYTDKLGLKIADVAYYQSKMYPGKIQPSKIGEYNFVSVKNCWDGARLGGTDNHLQVCIYKSNSKYLIGVQGTESFLGGIDSNLGIDFDILNNKFNRLESLSKCVATYIKQECWPPKQTQEPTSIIIGGHSLGGTIIMTIFMLAEQGNSDCSAVVNKIGEKNAILVNPFIGILPYMVKYSSQMETLNDNSNKSKLRMIVHPGDPASAFWRLYSTTNNLCTEWTTKGWFGTTYQTDAGEILYIDLRERMGKPALDRNHPGWDFSKTVLKDDEKWRNIFKISMYNGGCNSVFGTCSDDTKKKWCTQNHGLIAYTSSHTYGKSWMNIVNSM